MTCMSSIVIVADASVLINFLRIDRMDLIARHSHRFLVTETSGSTRTRTTSLVSGPRSSASAPRWKSSASRCRTLRSRE